MSAQRSYSHGALELQGDRNASFAGLQAAKPFRLMRLDYILCFGSPMALADS
jgi:hypothetical protein